MQSGHKVDRVKSGSMHQFWPDTLIPAMCCIALFSEIHSRLEIKFWATISPVIVWTTRQ